MRFAYIISAYHRLGQVTRLVQRLHTGDARFLVHVDRKTDAREYRELRDSLRDLPVHFLDRHTCHWGGFGHVRATLKGIDELCSGSIAFDYAILLTGQDYPIKPNCLHRAVLRGAASKVVHGRLVAPDRVVDPARRPRPDRVPASAVLRPPCATAVQT